MERIDITKEIDREKRMLEKGNERFLDRQESNKRLTTQENPHNLVKESLPRVSKEILLLINTEKEKGKGRKCKWIDDLDTIDPDILSYIGLNTFFECVSQGLTRTSCLTRIGKRIELESYSIELTKFDSKLAKRIERQVMKEHSSEIYRIDALKNIAGKEGFKPERWSKDRKTRAATPIYDAVLNASHVFEEWDESEPRKTKKKVGLTTEASALLAKLDFESSWNEPMLAPMIVKPRPWKDINTGCYRHPKLAAHVPLVRAATPEQRQAIRNQIRTSKELPLYIQALNALQETPLEINKDMLHVVKWCWENGKAPAKFPLKDYIEYPDKHDNWDELTDEQKKGIRLDIKSIRIKNREIDGARAVMQQDLATADELSNFEEFYLGWNMDFRSRVYPVSFFNYHRDDHVKSLFLLKEKSKITKDNVAWLAIHLANTGDFDRISKGTLEERIEWVNQNHIMIYSCGVDYEGSYEIWSKADKPFQFLSACICYANWCDNPDNCWTGLPIAIDGTNSGVQHYSASSLSRSEGKLVNLTADVKKPQDVYQKVADNVVKKLEQNKEKDELAKLWLDFGINRSICKRNTMCFGYSSKRYGFADQIYEDLMKPIEDKVLRGLIKEHPFGNKNEQKQAARYLANINYDVIRNLLKSVTQGMEFFQQCCDVLSKEGKPMRFRTPTDFPVIQRYNKWNKKRVRIFLHDRVAGIKKRSLVTLRERNKSKIDSKKARSAVSPNVIHSLDASHLLMTILHCRSYGVQSFFVVHDSFATVIDHTWTMFHCVRSTFVDMYKDWCLYEDMKDQVAQQLNDPMKITTIKIPEKGTLNLEEVRNSDYCFS
tara:strand:- start:1277 stop:3766 length:2490 start_codon:yes stop_codon:yes gene_type:complete